VAINLDFTILDILICFAFKKLEFPTCHLQGIRLCQTPIFQKKKKIFEGFATIFTLKNTFTLRVVCALGRNTQQPDVFRVEFLEVR
jgi:hypothetical protein